MTPERKKALLYLVLTFALGISVGILVPGFFRHTRYGARDHDGREGRYRGKLSEKIVKVLKADTSRSAAIRAITDQAETRVQQLDLTCNREMQAILDSMKAELKPLVTAEQYERLEHFAAHRGRGRNPEAPR